MILTFSLLSNPSQIFIDYGNGKNRKGLWLNEFDLSEKMKKWKTFFLHVLRSNYVAKIWKSSLLGSSEYPSIIENGEIVWVGDIFPDDVLDILMEDDYDEDKEIAYEGQFIESEDEFSDLEN